MRNSTISLSKSSLIVQTIHQYRCIFIGCAIFGDEREHTYVGDLENECITLLTEKS